MSNYREHLKNGPFPGRIDPWAERGRFFQQIHSGMIQHILEQIQDRLIDMGYIAAKELSLQVTEGSEPDIHVRRVTTPQDHHNSTWDYTLAAAEILAEAGVEVEDVELEAIHISEHRRGGALVAVLEIVSPSNKASINDIREYQSRRYRLRYQGVNVVEIDPTRSVMHLCAPKTTSWYSYHIAVHLPDKRPYVIGGGFEEPLKRFALPLREQVVPVEPQIAYHHAYRTAAIAAQMNDEHGYSAEALPFPTLLGEEQRKELNEAVNVWKAELARLAQAS